MSLLRMRRDHARIAMTRGSHAMTLYRAPAKEPDMDKINTSAGYRFGEARESGLKPDENHGDGAHPFTHGGQNEANNPLPAK